MLCPVCVTIGAAVDKAGAPAGVFSFPSYVQHIMGSACSHSLIPIVIDYIALFQSLRLLKAYIVLFID